MLHTCACCADFPGKLIKKRERTATATEVVLDVQRSQSLAYIEVLWAIKARTCHREGGSFNNHYMK
jgi:hypothetical protein